MNLNLYQTATYWAPGAPDEYGLVSFSAPVSMDCRWQDVAELYRDANGNELTSSSIVYFASDVLRQGWLFEGSSVAADPKTVDGASEIRRVDSSPNLTNTQSLYKVYL